MCTLKEAIGKKQLRAECVEAQRLMIRMSESRGEKQLKNLEKQIVQHSDDCYAQAAFLAAICEHFVFQEPDGNVIAYPERIGDLVRTVGGKNAEVCEYRLNVYDGASVQKAGEEGRIADESLRLGWYDFTIAEAV